MKKRKKTRRPVRKKQRHAGAFQTGVVCVLMGLFLVLLAAMMEHPEIGRVQEWPVWQMKPVQQLLSSLSGWENRDDGMVQMPSAQSSGLTVHFLDVGQADAAVLLCDGHAMMIDGGNAADSQFVYAYLTKTLGLNQLDVMIATHPHEDHIGGLSAALNACRVGKVYSPVVTWNTKVFASLEKYAGQQGLSLTIPQKGEQFSLGEAVVTFLSDGQGFSGTNDMSLVVRVDYGATSFLFTGDAEWDAEHALLSDGAKLSCTVLKVGHHGSETSTCYAFLREIMPQYAVISVGKGNSYGHPAESTISRLQDAGANILRTDESGTIICHSDGYQVTFTSK